MHEQQLAEIYQLHHLHFVHKQMRFGIIVHVMVQLIHKKLVHRQIELFQQVYSEL